MEQIALNWEPERRYYTVSELAGEVRITLARQFPDVWVSGEISGCKLATSGHYYFTLKDHGAQIRCVSYKTTARYLKFKPADGVAVLARGRVDFYDARGDLQMIVEAIEPQGSGALQFAFEQLKKRLADEGLFDAARKRPLPNLPERIGIVTSPTGAVIRDMLNVLQRRCPGRHIRIYPTPVQGEGAAGQIAQGIEYFSRTKWAEVVIVARGGGSLEDLWAFNEERVARALAACSVPVISAIGHETDFTIADFVADLRAPTPSAAAEIVVATRASLLDAVASVQYKMRQAMRLRVAMLARRFHRVEIQKSSLDRLIGRRLQAVDDREYRMRDRIRAIIARRRQRVELVASQLQRLDVRLRLAQSEKALASMETRMKQAMERTLQRARNRAGLATAHLTQLSPVKILDRGYAIVLRDGHVVKSPQDAPSGSDIRVRLASGELGARVTGNNAK